MDGGRLNAGPAVAAADSWVNLVGSIWVVDGLVLVAAWKAAWHVLVSARGVLNALLIHSWVKLVQDLTVVHWAGISLATADSLGRRV